MLKARLCACVAVFFWGAAYLWGKAAMEWLTPITATTARFVIAAIVLFIIVCANRQLHLKPFKGHWWHYFLLGFIGISCFQALLFLAVYLTSPINVAVIMALSPVFTAVLETVVSQQMPSLRTILALIISVLGATLATLGGDSLSAKGFSLNWGDLVAVLAALSFSFYTVASRRWLIKTVSSITNMALIMAIGALILLPLGLNSLPHVPPSSLTPIWAIVGLGLGSTVIAYLCWTKAVEEIGVSEPNLLYNFMPVVTMILSSLQGVNPSFAQIIGSFIVIAGISWAIMQKKSSNLMVETLTKTKSSKGLTK